MANLKTLVQKREDLLFKFGVKTLNNPKTSYFIKKNESSKIVRNSEKYTVEFARNTRFAKSTINAIAHLLNRN